MWIVDWYLGLGWREKLVVGLATAVGLFLASFLVSMAVLPFLVSPQSDEPSQQADATVPEVTQPGEEASLLDPDFNMKVTEARWVGQKAVVEGRWWGDTDISSMHCDLFEGNEDVQRAIRWWDRSVAASMDWSEKTFSQDFVETPGGEPVDQLDPASEYTVTCSGYFSGGWSMATTVPVEGTPPG